MSNPFEDAEATSPPEGRNPFATPLPRAPLLVQGRGAGGHGVTGGVHRSSGSSSSSDNPFGAPCGEGQPRDPPQQRGEQGADIHAGLGRQRWQQQQQQGQQQQRHALQPVVHAAAGVGPRWQQNADVIDRSSNPFEPLHVSPGLLRVDPQDDNPFL
ncbi:MAG: hypothetical protein WDW38_011493 [Sanguina aurantia]